MRRERAGGGRHLFPSIAEKLYEVSTVGVAPEFYGKIHEHVGGRRLPHQAQQTQEVLEKLWKPIRRRKAFICSRSKICDGEGFSPTPSGLVAKKNTDRTISVDTRLISDLRAVNLGFQKQDLFPVWVPPIIDIVEEIQRRRRRFPKMTVLMCKRDIEGSSNRIFIRPDLSRLLMAELDGRLVLVLAFGWIASPAYFQLFGTSIQAIHESYGMDDIGWSGSGHLSPFIYVDDAIWVENAFGSRLTGSLEAWEWACRRILNDGAVNDIKTKLEGEWITTDMILGFTADTETNWISATEPKITAAQNIILSDEFVPGNTQIRLKTLQKLRGSCRRWLIASSFFENYAADGRHPFRVSRRRGSW